MSQSKIGLKKTSKKTELHTCELEGYGALSALYACNGSHELLYPLTLSCVTNINTNDCYIGRDKGEISERKEEGNTD